MIYLLNIILVICIVVALCFWAKFVFAPIPVNKPALADHLREEMLKLCNKYPDVFLEKIEIAEDSFGVHYDLTFDIPHMDDRKMYAIGIYEQELLIDEAKTIRIVDSLIRNTFEEVV